MYCSVPSCNSHNRRNKELSFHEFPSDLNLRCKWIKAIPLDPFSNKCRHASDVVCSKHFKDDDFIPNRKLKRLHRNAVPSVFEQTEDSDTEKCAKRNLFEPCVSHLTKKPKFTYGKRPTVTVDDSDSQESSNTHTSDLKLADGCSMQLSLNASESKLNDSNFQQASVLEHSKSEHEAFRSQFTQTYVDISFSELSLKLKKLQRTLDITNKTICTLENELKEHNTQLHYYEKNDYISNLKEMLSVEKDGLADNHMLFILTQIRNFGRKRPRWPEVIIRECLKLHAISPRMYKMIHCRNLLQLPSHMALHRYNGPANTGFTDDLIEQSPEDEI